MRWSTGPIDGPSVNPQTGDDIRRSQVQWHQTKHPCTPGRKIPSVFPHPNDDSMIIVGTNMSRNPQKAPPLSSIPRITRMGRSSHLVTTSRSRSLIQSEEGGTLAGESQSDYKSHSGSSSSGTSASSSDATSTGDVKDPPNNGVQPVHNAIEPNRWCVEGQYQIFNKGKIQNEQQKQALTITEERRVLTGCLHIVPTIEEL
uniref:Integrase core domain containing protein n=1 Tax=Solanum tuberosum TaxID=4113 RepID=M1DPE3_SOLTU